MVFFENMILFYKYYLNVQSKQEYRLEKRDYRVLYYNFARHSNCVCLALRKIVVKELEVKIDKIILLVINEWKYYLIYFNI